MDVFKSDRKINTMHVDKGSYGLSMYLVISNQALKVEIIHNVTKTRQLLLWMLVTIMNIVCIFKLKLNETSHVTYLLTTCSVIDCTSNSTIIYLPLDTLLEIERCDVVVSSPIALRWFLLFTDKAIVSPRASWNALFGEVLTWQENNG